MGKLSRRGSEGGYILLDVLVALFIVLIGFSVFLGGMGLAGRHALRLDARVHRMIEQRNADAKNFTISFRKE